MAKKDVTWGLKKVNDNYFIGRKLMGNKIEAPEDFCWIKRGSTYLIDLSKAIDLDAECDDDCIDSFVEKLTKEDPDEVKCNIIFAQLKFVIAEYTQNGGKYEREE